MEKLNVVLGVGPLGRAVTGQLVKQGERARVVNRSGLPTKGLEGVETYGADLSHPKQTLEALTDAKVVYLCAAPKFSSQTWEQQLPQLWENVLEAAAKVGAKVVIGDNLYMYDQTPGLIREDLPYVATTRKGKARAKAASLALNAHRDGKVQVAIARGSDFFGPWATEQSHLGSRVFPALLQGKPVQLLGDPDQPHSYTFIEDFGRAMVLLAGQERAYGQVWHVPNADTKSTVELLTQAAKLIHQPLKIQRTSRAMLRLGGLFVPAAREALEMFYQRERPYVVDCEKFAQAFGNLATPWSESLRRTLVWFRQHQQTGAESPRPQRT